MRSRAGSVHDRSKRRLSQEGKTAVDRNPRPFKAIGHVHFTIPVPEKPPILISVAENVDAEDWGMAEVTVRNYFGRKEKAKD